MPGRENQAYEKRAPETWTAAECFHASLHHDPDYNVVRALCNNAKHFNDESGVGADSDTFRGFFVGLNFAGDSLGHRNYVVGGEDLRKILGRLMKRYHEYFRV